jgi:hypothetical protein
LGSNAYRGDQSYGGSSQKVFIALIRILCDALNGRRFLLD